MGVRVTCTCVIVSIGTDNCLCSVTQREDEAKETWRAMDEQKNEEFKNGPLSNWGFEGEGLVKGTKKLIKVRKPATFCHTLI